MRSILLACILSLLTMPALARPDAATLEQARGHYRSASAYFERGQYDEAVREFLVSYQLSGKAELLYNVAKCYLRKGDAARAVDYYRGYLNGKPRARDRAQVIATIRDLKPRIGRLHIEGAPAGSALFVNGAPVGRAPRDRVTATAGSATVEARLSDGSVRSARVQVKARSETVVELAAPANATAAAADAAKATSGDTAQAAQPGTADAVTPAPEIAKPDIPGVKPASPWWTDKPGWAVAGVGAVLLIGVAPLAVFANRQTEQTRTAPSEDFYFRHRGEAKALRASTIAAAAAGAAALGVAAALFATHTKRESKEGVALRVVPMGAGLAVAGAF